MSRVPRHFFMDAGFDELAYLDRSFPIEADQTISHPYTVAYQTQLLGVKKHEKVLEVGTGSAYQSAVLAELGVRVHTIERQRKLYDQVQAFGWLKKIGSHFCNHPMGQPERKARSVRVRFCIFTSKCCHGQSCLGSRPNGQRFCRSTTQTRLHRTMYLWRSSTAQALLRSTRRLPPALPAVRAVVLVAEVPPAAVVVAAAVAAFSR